MAFLPQAGSAGRLQTLSGHTITTGITSWQITSASEIFKVTNFESAADSNGVIGEAKIGSNIGDYKAAVTGWYNADTTNSDLVFPFGISLLVDFLYQKTGALGFYQKTAFVSNFVRGPKLREAQSFTLELEISGPLGAPTTS